jgi:DNA-binding NarL/FixJ family response regulator
MAGNKSRIRILIMSGHPVFRDGLHQVLEADAGIEVVGLASDGKTALRLARRLNPNIVLFDPAMSSSEDWEALKRLSSLPSVRTILLSAFHDQDRVMEVFRLGVRGVISKTSPLPVLLRCLWSVMAGQFWVGSDHVNNMVEALDRLTPSTKSESRTKNSRITPRELEVVAAVAAARTNKVIARELAVSEQTVKHHLTNIYGKLGLSGRLELALFAANHRLVNTG